MCQSKFLAQTSVHIFFSQFFYPKVYFYLFLLNFHREDAKNPCFWSRICLQNMAKLAKEATTMRRVLESLFRYFDNGKLWPTKNGLAFPVLKDMQILMDDSGINITFIVKNIFPPFIWRYLWFSP